VIGYQEYSPNGGEILVYATLPLNADPSQDHDFAIVELPEIEQAATIVHHGSMDNVIPSIQTLDRRKWMQLGGLQS
jgi:effector-binding domain-containing protein